MAAPVSPVFPVTACAVLCVESSEIGDLLRAQYFRSRRGAAAANASETEARNQEHWAEYAH